jgi:hypothetical protein
MLSFHSSVGLPVALCSMLRYFEQMKLGRLQISHLELKGDEIHEPDPIREVHACVLLNPDFMGN